jgi:DNA processing protein
MQISTISFQDPHFPDILTAIKPSVNRLYYLGELPKGTDKLVAIVGTRKSTAYGRGVAYRLGFDLAQAGVTVVSGLAAGIDGLAHRGALDAGGRTIAVLGHGLNQIYPAQHRDMAKEILATGGALVSEYPEGTPPARYTFPARNRIIAALSDLTVVVESAQQGGALITANQAEQAGRQVMAVPGNITSPVSVGPNNLIRKGVGAVVSYTDIMTALGYLKHEATPVSARSPEEAKLIELIGPGSKATQDLIDASGLGAAEFANIISLMEITGKVRNLGAGQWARR